MSTPTDPRQIPLSTAYNARELGGLPTPDGVTAAGVLIRCDVLSMLTEEDLAALRRAKLSAVIDLRGPEITDKVKSAFLDSREVRYLNIPLLTDPQRLRDRLGGMELHEAFLHHMGDLYCAILDCEGEAFAAVFAALREETEHGAVAFHCTNGKDRTALIAALCLELAGVAEEEIVADYAQSEARLLLKWNELPEGCPVRPFGIMKTPAAAMEQTLRYLRERWGGAEGYLTACSVPKETISLLRRRLTAQP
ncbi:MAG: tyrosine-protein phosphatase [Clostridia bacterium]|nr:tyrosine-protein phosphatase [Clostridia bacterium]